MFSPTKKLLNDFFSVAGRSHFAQDILLQAKTWKTPTKKMQEHHLVYFNRI